MKEELEKYLDDNQWQYEFTSNEIHAMFLAQREAERLEKSHLRKAQALGAKLTDNIAACKTVELSPYMILI